MEQAPKTFKALMTVSYDCAIEVRASTPKEARKLVMRLWDQHGESVFSIKNSELEIVDLETVE